MLKKLQSKKTKHTRRNLLLLLLVLTLGLADLIVVRVRDYLQLRKQTMEHVNPLVSLVPAAPVAAEEKVVLPGSILAWHEAPIFARTNGYVAEWQVDIGSVVKEGDLLARIETPELNAQLRQAEADLKVAIAENKLAQTTAIRWLHLVKTDSVSKQSTDEKVDAAHAAAAMVLSRRANRDRLYELVGFERVIAPFSGVISDRRTDIGALINNGSKPNEAQPLFRIVQLNPLRLYVKIPQRYVSRINSTMVVNLRFPQFPGKTFPARLMNTAHAVDPTTRTLLAQFEVQNNLAELSPGSYTEVQFMMPSFPKAVRLPVNTLIFRREGLQVATVNAAKRVLLKNITIDRDFGNQVEIASGIAPGELVIINPSDGIYSGQKVRIASTKATV